MKYMIHPHIEFNVGEALEKEILAANKSSSKSKQLGLFTTVKILT